MRENRQLAGKITELERVLAELERQKSRAEQELPRVREAAEDALRRQRRDAADIALQKVRAESEAERYRRELQAVERDLRGFREQLAEHSAAQRALEERLTRKDCSLQELERQRGELMAELSCGHLTPVTVFSLFRHVPSPQKMLWSQPRQRRKREERKAGQSAASRSKTFIQEIFVGLPWWSSG